VIPIALSPTLFKQRAKSVSVCCLISFTLLFLCYDAYAHGGVFLEKDICVIKIGFFKAHFTIYQPRISRHKEFCEDIPNVTESVFVIEYLHDSLRKVPVDFRIIEDVQDFGRFVTWEDLEIVDDLNRGTVFYQPPLVRPNGVFLALHSFEKKGNYIGIMTAKHPTNDDTYTAVFPFQVGGNHWGYIPFIIALILLVQLSYWLLNGGYVRLRKFVMSPQNNA